MLKQFGIHTTIATVTGIYPTLSEVITAQSGIAPALTEVIATNREAGVREIILYDGSTRMQHGIPLPASGTVIQDNFTGGKLPLSTSSGLFASIDLAGSVEMTVRYITYDDKLPVPKWGGRSATSSGNGLTITRCPRFGHQ